MHPCILLKHLTVDWLFAALMYYAIIALMLFPVMDPSMAPPGKHTLHAYMPATEPYELWAGLDRRR